jgi:hypothetical protein
MAIYSCKGCEKRTPGCHSKCPDYLAEKAEHDRLKAEADKKRDISIGIRDQRTRGVNKAIKSRRAGGKYEQ